MRNDVRENLTTAKQMEAQGMDANEIWLATGWFRGVEGQWKYMISDRPSMVKISAQALYEESKDQEGRREYTLEEVLHHPELFQTFPELKSIPVTTHNGEGTMVQVIEGKYKMQIDPEYPIMNSPTPDGMLTGMILHETQHIIQKMSGFAQGGNIHAALFIAEEALDLAPDDPKVAALKKSLPGTYTAESRVKWKPDWFRTCAPTMRLTKFRSIKWMWHPKTRYWPLVM